MIKDKSIFIKNIYYMLSYAFTTLNQGEYEDIAKESFDHIHDLFAAILAKGIARQLKQGLYREYIGKEENLTELRGKIDLNGTIRNRMAKKQQLSCEYDELSENILLNQILKTTAFLLMRHPDVASDHKMLLKQEMLFFSNVDTVKQPSMIRWSNIRFHRNNASYRMLISLCQLVLEGMLLTNEQGEYRLASFLDQQHMERLYEKFILEYYQQEHPELHTAASQVSWALDEGVGTMLPTMQTDITLSKGKNVLIIDAKYYTKTLQSQYDTYSIHSGNLYQIFTYVKNKTAEYKDDPHTVSGMLLYAKTDEQIQPDQEYKLDGNWFYVKTLDLNCPFSEIREQLDVIAQLI